MNFDDPRISLHEPLPELANEEVRSRILISGTEEELEKLRVFLDVTAEQIILFRFYAQQRRKVIDETYIQVANRKETNPKATAEEMSMGEYCEYLEPQVRDAVLTLRKKGYPTYFFGYDKYASQGIGLMDPFLKNYHPSGDLLCKIEPYDVDLKVSDEYIGFVCHRGLSLVELKVIWDFIAEDIPDRGQPATDSWSGIAENFRKRQAKIKK